MAKLNYSKNSNKKSASGKRGGVLQRPVNISGACVSTVNIKGFKNGDEAVLYVNSLLERRNNAVKVYVLIHGYGSGGAEIGSVTKDAVRTFLHNVYKVYNKATVINGEDFTIFSADARDARDRFPELESYMQMRNPGVTMVIFK
jgi:hypothetical protein